MAEVVAGDGALSNVGLIACDLDGVVYVDGGPVEGAGEALSRIAAAGIRIVFVTNNSAKTARMVVEDVAGMTGYWADPGDVLTASMVTAREMAGRFRRAFVIGKEAIDQELRAVGIEVTERAVEADAVVVGLDDRLTYARLADAARAIRSGAAFYATNADPTYPTREGLMPGGGAIVAALATAAGTDPIVCGKPHLPMRAAVREVAGDLRVLVVGDQPATDLAMGKAEGWRTALVLSGVTASAEDVPDHLRPDLVATSLSEVADAIAGQRPARVVE